MSFASWFGITKTFGHEAMLPYSAIRGHPSLSGFNSTVNSGIPCCFPARFPAYVAKQDVTPSFQTLGAKFPVFAAPFPAAGADFSRFGHNLRFSCLAAENSLQNSLDQGIYE